MHVIANNTEIITTEKKNDTATNGTHSENLYKKCFGLLEEQRVIIMESTPSTRCIQTYTTIQQIQLEFCIIMMVHEGSGIWLYGIVLSNDENKMLVHVCVCDNKEESRRRRSIKRWCIRIPWQMEWEKKWKLSLSSSSTSWRSFCRKKNHVKVTNLWAFFTHFLYHPWYPAHIAL